jgi:hypothetical protein
MSNKSARRERSWIATPGCNWSAEMRSVAKGNNNFVTVCLKGFYMEILCVLIGFAEFYPILIVVL